MTKRQRTKIIATLGDPQKEKVDEKGKFELDEKGVVILESTYEKGIFGLDLQPLEAPDIAKIIHLLLTHGADLLRINLAHVRTELIDGKFRKIKEAILKEERTLNRRIGVLVDLPGPKIRLKSGDLLLPKDTLILSFAEIEEELTPLPEGRPIEPSDRPSYSKLQVNLGDTAFAATDPVAEKAVESMRRQIDKLRSEGEEILAFLGDNEAILRVIRMQGSEVECRIVSTPDEHGALRGKKRGFAIRGITKSISAFTPEDREKLSAVLTADHETEGERIISHIGISFCQTREDARQVQQFMIEKLAELENPIRPKKLRTRKDLQSALVHTPLLIAKIETGLGVENISRILDIADGAMIARGDLALEIETTDLPARAKALINHCNLRGKPVIMATKMLESMQTAIECSRSEATDVFEAVVDNVDALMLSGETSSGMYPAHALTKMAKLADNAEEYLWGNSWKPAQGPVEEFHFADDAAPREEYAEAQASQEEDLIQGYYQKLSAMKLRTKNWRERWGHIGANYAREAGRRDTSFLRASEFITILSSIKTSRLSRQESTDRISLSACMMSVDSDVFAIVAPTTSGRTVRMLARFRPPKWILALPHTQLVARKLSIDRGVLVPDVLSKKYQDDAFQELSRDSRKAVAKELSGKSAVFTCGLPLGSVGTTNVIHRWEKESAEKEGISPATPAKS